MTMAPQQLATREIGGEAISATALPHFASLDAIRGLAAVMVVANHIPFTNPTIGWTVFRSAGRALDIFFVLSGFVIFYAYQSKLSSLVSARRFIWLRFWRVYPLHFVFLLVFLLFDVLKLIGERHGLSAYNPAFVADTPAAFLANLFLIQGMDGVHALTFNLRAWTISVEFYTYLVFVAACLACQKFKPMFVLLCGAIFVSAYGFLFWVAPGGFEGMINGMGFVRCLTGFFLGGLTFLLYQKIRRTHWIGTLCATGWPAFAVTALLLAYICLTPLGPADFAAYPIVALFMLIVLLSPGAMVSRLLMSRAPQWLGETSYSIYMTHGAVLWLITMLLRFGFHVPSAATPDGAFELMSPWAGSAAAVVAIIASLMASRLVYLHIEKPVRDWSRRTKFRSAQPAVLPG